MRLCRFAIWPREDVRARSARPPSLTLDTSRGITTDLRLVSHRVTTTGLPEGPARQTAETVLGVGEKVFDYTAAMSYTSGYFEREPKK